MITRFTYDDIGRNKKTSWEIEGNDNVFEVDVGFDTIGRLGSITYPRLPSESELLSPPRFRVDYQYSPIGDLLAVTDAATGAPYWAADAREPDGQIGQETYGNGVVGMREYEPETGLLLSLTADGPGVRLDELVYDYDDNRNVRLREDRVGAARVLVRHLLFAVEGARASFHHRSCRRRPGTIRSPFVCTARPGHRRSRRSCAAEMR